MKQTSVANLTEKSTYSSDDYVVVDNLTNTNKMKLNVIEDNVKEASKTYVENNYVITEKFRTPFKNEYNHGIFKL